MAYPQLQEHRHEHRAPGGPVSLLVPQLADVSTSSGSSQSTELCALHVWRVVHPGKTWPPLWGLEGCLWEKMDLPRKAFKMLRN